MENDIESVEKQFLLEEKEDSIGNSIENSTASNETVDIDEYLVRIGQCGCYQIRLVILLKLITFPSAFPVFIFYFIGVDPPWILLKDMSVHPKDDDLRCRLNRSEWTYDYSKSSVVTEYDLVCQHTWLIGLVGSSVFIGWGCGSILMGYLSDLYGRKTVMFPCIFMDLLCLLVHAFVNSIPLLIFVRFMMGVFHSAPALNAFILLVEFIGPKCRVIASNIAASVWVLGAAVLALKGYLIDDWRILCAVCSAPYFVCLLFGICFPESIRWLNSKNRTAEAEKILQHAAKVNNTDMTNVGIKSTVATDYVKLSYLDLFKDWAVAKMVLSQAFLWYAQGVEITVNIKCGEDI